jgi:hypothetical protein
LGRSPAAIRSLGLPDDITNKLLPYANLQGQAALTYLRKNPLTFTRDQIDQINNAEFEQNLGAVRKTYDTNTGKPGSFDKLTGPQKTVLTSVSYQWGTNLPVVKNANIRNLYANMVAGKWDKVQASLEADTSKYSGRRHQEGDVLKNKGWQDPSGRTPFATPKCSAVGGMCSASCNGGKVTKGLCPGASSCCVGGSNLPTPTPAPTTPSTPAPVAPQPSAPTQAPFTPTGPPSAKCAAIRGSCTSSCPNGKVTHGLCPGSSTCCVSSASGSGSGFNDLFKAACPPGTTSTKSGTTVLSRSRSRSKLCFPCLKNAVVGAQQSGKGDRTKSLQKDMDKVVRQAEKLGPQQSAQVRAALDRLQREGVLDKKSVNRLKQEMRNQARLAKRSGNQTGSSGLRTGNAGMRPSTGRNPRFQGQNRASGRYPSRSNTAPSRFNDSRRGRRNQFGRPPMRNMAPSGYGRSRNPTGRYQSRSRSAYQSQPTGRYQSHPSRRTGQVNRQVRRQPSHSGQIHHSLRGPVKQPRSFQPHFSPMAHPRSYPQHHSQPSHQQGHSSQHGTPQRHPSTQRRTSQRHPSTQRRVSQRHPSTQRRTQQRHPSTQRRTQQRRPSTQRRTQRRPIQRRPQQHHTTQRRQAPRHQQQRRQTQRRRVQRRPIHYTQHHSLSVSSARSTIQTDMIEKIRSKLGYDWVNELASQFGGVHGKRFANYLADGVNGVEIPMIDLSDSDKIKFDNVLRTIVGGSFAKRLPKLSYSRAMKLISKYDAKIKRRSHALKTITKMVKQMTPTYVQGPTTTNTIVVKINGKPYNGEETNPQMEKIIKMSARARRLIRRMEHRNEMRRLHGRTRKLLKRLAREMKV